MRNTKYHSSNLSHKIRAILAYHEATPKELAQMFNPPVTSSTINKWLRGGKPSEHNLKELARIGDVEIEWLKK